MSKYTVYLSCTRRMFLCIEKNTVEIYSKIFEIPEYIGTDIQEYSDGLNMVRKFNRLSKLLNMLNNLNIKTLEVKSLSNKQYLSLYCVIDWLVNAGFNKDDIEFFNIDAAKLASARFIRAMTSFMNNNRLKM